MKKVLPTFLTLTVLLAVTGCAPMTVANRTLPFPQTIKQGDIIEDAIDVAGEIGLPAATKIDKQNGLVVFGGFGTPEMGFTAQVRIKSENEIEVSVQRGSAYIPLKADDKVDLFVSKLKERINGAKIKVVK
jgi:hypothetical protein